MAWRSAVKRSEVDCPSFAKDVRSQRGSPQRKMKMLERYFNYESRRDRQHASRTRICRNGLLRSGEGIKVRFRHLSWSADRTRLRLLIHDSKCNKKGRLEAIDMIDWGEGSAVACWRNYLNDFDLWGLDGEALLFGCFYTAAFVARIKELVQKAGIDGDFAGHSLQSGRACDLCAANVPVESTMKMGR